jgi:hypothetical protein
MNWFYSGSNTKSIAELDSLANDVIWADDFDRDHVQGFSTARELNRLDEYSESAQALGLEVKDGWTEASVNLRLPATRVKHTSEEDAPQFEVKGIHYRPLTEVIKSAFQDATAKTFHFTPFQLFWQPFENQPPQRTISELYNSDAVLEEHAKIQSQPREPGCNLETAIASIMVWSDATHLANFGTASLWPIYMFFGNQSKYARGKPTTFAAHHIAYIPSVHYSFLSCTLLHWLKS